MTLLLRDLSHALRSLSRRPAFTVTIVASLAIGFGANTTIMSVVDSVLLRPIASTELRGLVAIRLDVPEARLLSADISPIQQDEISRRSDLFSQSAGFGSVRSTLTGRDAPVSVMGQLTLGDFFGIFSVRPFLGQFYGPADSEEGRPPVVVLSYHGWRQLAGGDSTVVGRALELDGQHVTIVGVAPPDFQFPSEALFWRPFTLSENWRRPANRWSLMIRAVARLRPGIATHQAEARLVGLIERYRNEGDRRAQSDAAASPRFRVMPFDRFLAAGLRPILVVVSITGAILLLITCANVANMQLVRAVERAREVAVRIALGAERSDIARQLFVESFILTAIGSGSGLVLGWLGIRFLEYKHPEQVPQLGTLEVSGFTIVVVVIAALIVGLALGALAVVRAGRIDVAQGVRDSLRVSSLGIVQRRLLSAGVVVQVALALTLLLCAGLTIRSLRLLGAVDPGFRAANVLTIRIALPSARYQNSQRVTFFQELLERVRSIPGVQSVGLITTAPFNGSGDSSPFDIIGMAAHPNDPDRHAYLRTASGGYFRSVGIPILLGRDFDESTDRPGSPVAIVDQTLVDQYFRGADPIGKQISQGTPATIVGVVGSIRQAELADVPKATIYYYFRDRTWYSSYTVVLRSVVPMAALTSQVRAVVGQMDRTVPLIDAKPLSDRMSASLTTRRLVTGLLSSFAAISLSLALVGIYGLLTYVTSRRTTEIGIRLALGATPTRVSAAVVIEGLTLVTLGVGSGVLAFIAVAHVMRSLVYGIEPGDPLTIVLSAATVMGTSALASYLPARRASRVDPIVALRNGG